MLATLDTYRRLAKIDILKTILQLKIRRIARLIGL